MKYLRIFVVITSVILVTGCAGTSLVVDQEYVYQNSDYFTHEIIDQANVSPEGMSIFKSRLDSRMSSLGLSDTNNANKKIEITFTNYYMRHGAARHFVGVMAGVDNITSSVVVKNVESGEIIGKMQVVSKNPTANGTSRNLIQQHADKIANYIKTGRK